jgi:hypothetical protein
VAHARATLATPDTRNIYQLTSNDALNVLDGMALATTGPARVGAVLFSGTGMPSLRAVTAAAERGLRAISSNLCLAGSLSRKLGIQAVPRGELAPRMIPQDWDATVASL